MESIPYILKDSELIAIFFLISQSENKNGLSRLRTKHQTPFWAIRSNGIQL